MLSGVKTELKTKSAGFTLLEVMIAAGLTLLLLGIIIKIFKVSDLLQNLEKNYRIHFIFEENVPTIIIYTLFHITITVIRYTFRYI